MPTPAAIDLRHHPIGSRRRRATTPNGAGREDEFARELVELVGSDVTVRTERMAPGATTFDGALVAVMAGAVRAGRTISRLVHTDCTRRHPGAATHEPGQQKHDL